MREIEGSPRAPGKISKRCKDRAGGFHHNLGKAKTRRLASEAPASGCAVREVASFRAHANHLLFREFDGVGVDDHPLFPRLTGGGGQDDRGRLAGGAEAVLFDETTPIYRGKDRRDDYAQTIATSVFALFPDRVEWSAHAAPDECDSLSGTMRVV
ncbi:C45 family peptidase [Mesorhizobium australicum]|uniref:hypothetical protein n=1 Tax=Mesorhizobium australicum TaxID=536018 RepID=UPI003339F8EC